MKPEHWPITIVADRYAGCYSGAAWVAYHCDGIPYGPHDDDVSAMHFWAGPTVFFGRGETPQEALNSLVSKLDLDLEAAGREPITPPK